MNEKSCKYNFTNEIGYNSSVRFLKNTMGMFLINEIRNDYKNKGIDIPLNKIASLIKESKDINSFINVNDPIFEAPGDMLNKLDKYLTLTKQEKPKTAGECMKLIYKSMVKTYKQIILELEEITSKKINTIVIVGGGNQAEVLNQLLADECNMKVIIGSSEATIFGNAMAQFIALKDIKDVVEGRNDISRSIETKMYYPKGYKGENI